MMAAKKDLTDSEYVWQMYYELRKQPSSEVPEMKEHLKRLRRIAWKLNVLQYVEERLKAIRRNGKQDLP